MKCRFDGSPLSDVVLDLGVLPLANALARSQSIALATNRYPLRILFNPRNGLLQTDVEIDPGEIFTDEYPYFSSTSRIWLSHAQDFAREAVRRFKLTTTSRVLEIGSNDGYLLRNFLDQQIPCLGIEPVAALAQTSRVHGISTLNEPFSLPCAKRLLRQCGSYDLIVANNVIAHIPDLRGTLLGIRTLLSPVGTAVIEFPHLVPMIEQGAFDAVYHEHVYYFSLTAMRICGGECGLAVVDVEKLSTHGGSLRIYLQHKEEDEKKIDSSRIRVVHHEEEVAGVMELDFLNTLQTKAEASRRAVQSWLEKDVLSTQTVTAYPASAKGTILLNYCNVTTDQLLAVADKASAKQGKFIPGAGMPIVDIPTMLSMSPDYIIITAQNILPELVSEIRSVGTWQGKVVLIHPTFRILPVDSL